MLKDSKGGFVRCAQPFDAPADEPVLGVKRPNYQQGRAEEELLDDEDQWVSQFVLTERAEPIDEAEEPNADVQSMHWVEDETHPPPHLLCKLRVVMKVVNHRCQRAEQQVLRQVDESEEGSKIPRVEPCSSHPDHLQQRVGYGTGGINFTYDKNTCVEETCDSPLLGPSLPPPHKTLDRASYQKECLDNDDDIEDVFGGARLALLLKQFESLQLFFWHCHFLIFGFPFCLNFRYY